MSEKPKTKRRRNPHRHPHAYSIRTLVWNSDRSEGMEQQALIVCRDFHGVLEYIGGDLNDTHVEIISIQRHGPVACIERACRK